MEGALRLRRPDLVIDDPLGLLVRFFSEDRSSTGSRSYDVYVAGGTSPTNRVVEQDIVAINTTMSARSPHKDWADLIAKGELNELIAVAADWDLFLTPDSVWTDCKVPDLLEQLFSVVVGKGIAISRATKVLHIKRPNLIPVCDSYVLRLMGIPGETAGSGVAMIEHLRVLREHLLPTLLGLRDALMKLGYERSLVRIADGLIWGSYPDTWLGRSSPAAPGAAVAGDKSLSNS